MMPGAAAAVEEEEKTEFDVLLKEIGPKKIQVIKAVRTFRADLGLKEAKELVEKAPTNVKEGISKEEVDGLIQHVIQWSPVFNTFSRPVNMVAESA